MHVELIARRRLYSSQIGLACQRWVSNTAGSMGDAAIFSYEYSGELTYDCNQWNSSTAMERLCQTYDAGEFKEHKSNIDISLHPQQYRGFIWHMLLVRVLYYPWSQLSTSLVPSPSACGIRTIRARGVWERDELSTSERNTCLCLNWSRMRLLKYGSWQHVWLFFGGRKILERIHHVRISSLGNL